MTIVELCYACLLPLPKRYSLLLCAVGLVRVHDRLACRKEVYGVNHTSSQSYQVRVPTS